MSDGDLKVWESYQVLSLAYRMGIACAMESAHLMENEWFIENEGNDDT